MTALVIAEHDHTALHSATLHAITAASQAAATVHVLVAGQHAQPVATAAAQVAGVAQVLHADGPAHAHQLVENLAAQVVALVIAHTQHGGATRYTHIVCPATAAGKALAPRVAALLDVAQVSEVTRVVAPDTFERPIYAGNAIATVHSSDALCVLTVRGTAFAPAAASGGTAEVVAIAPVADSGRSRFVSRALSRSERPELTSAKVVVSGGRALGSAEQFQAVLAPLADKLGAALGASRAAVDAGYAANDLQVGQTGKIVAPQLYVACGISGAIQHLAGMKDAKVIVAINKDPEAPIFQLADVGLEADLFAAVPALAAQL